MSKQAVMSMLPQLEELYNSTKEDYYKLSHNEHKGTYMVSRRDIETGDVILIEKPLYSQPLGYSPSFLQRTDVAPLMSTVTQFAQSHGHLSGADKYPPEARKALNRITELKATELMSKSPRINDIWHLHDAHRCAEVGDKVMIDGLVSENGQKLNGKTGQVVGRDERDANRLAVETLVIKNGNERRTRTSIKPGNLKTLGGISRTNAFESDDERTLLLFKVLSRINHACGKAANVMKLVKDDKAYVLAMRDIRAGEEILIDYIPQVNQEDRVGLLRLKYNFLCQCPEHEHVTTK